MQKSILISFYLSNQLNSIAFNFWKKDFCNFQYFIEQSKEGAKKHFLSLSYSCFQFVNFSHEEREAFRVIAFFQLKEERKKESRLHFTFLLSFP